ncbi:MAG: isochorismatase family protein [Pseudomonadota bacterium]
MHEAARIKRSLVDVNDSVLIVIDIQDYFLRKYDRAKSQRVTSHVAWLLLVARHLKVPVIATAEDIDRNGGVTDAIAAALPPGTPVHDKDVFNLVDEATIMASVLATGRGTAICVGVETDVCVAHSAMGLLSMGYNVVIPQDGVASMETDEEIGLMRMQSAGAVISSVKALYYEWMRGVSQVRAFRALVPEIEEQRPPSLVL